mgnify:CR=1 FL=1
MLKKFLKDVIILVVGKQAEEISELLDSKKYVNEFLIAKKMNITINQTRNILYKLSDKGLVSSIRKKDKKKGWYTYFWKIETVKTLDFLKDLFNKNIEQINYQIKSREIKDFYVCEKCSIELNEENALLCNFTCNECGNIFSLKDNSKLIREMKRQKERYEKELQEIEEDLMIEKEKDEKMRQKGIKKEEKIKDDAKKKAKKERERQRKKEEKKSGKKISKVKKVSKVKNTVKKVLKKISKKKAKKRK